ncbi:MAG: hypothetical protein GY869_32745 [Planctomycetes bacterium]|nr:hypothetical protein [Planctomycetota bacterium]
MLIPRIIRHRTANQYYSTSWILIGLIAVLLSGCSSPNDYYLNNGQLVDSPEGSAYGSGPSRYQYSQNGTEQWQNTNSQPNQPVGVNQQNNMNNPGMYDSQNSQYPQGVNPANYQNFPNNGQNGYPGNPQINSGQQTGGLSSPVDERYFGAYVRPAIENRRTSQQQAINNQQYQNQNAVPPAINQDLQGASASDYPTTSGNPAVSNVGVSEIGFPPGAANPSQVDQIVNTANATADPMNYNQLNQSYNQSGGIIASNQLPTIQVPVPRGINRSLTQPAVGANSVSYGSIESFIQQKERWFADHPDDINTAMLLYRYYLTEGNIQKAQSFLPKNDIQADLAQQNLKDLNQQISESESTLLKISNLKICEKVEDFGRYSELPAQELQSGKSRWVEVYFELENYVNRLNTDGMFSSELHAEITLYDGSYRPVITPLSKDVPPKPTYSKRDDFFLVGTIQLPALNPGPYILTVQVKDKIANKRSRRQELYFNVGTNLNANDNYGLSTIR